MKSQSTTLEQKENIQEEKEDFQQGRLVFMWDKKKCKPSMNKEFDDSWQGLYKVEKKCINDSYYLSTLERRRLPLPISVSLLKPHYIEET
jgi:hypothetical protein